MSFIEFPFCFPSRAIENDIPVNFNLMVTFSKQEIPDVKNGNKKEYKIVFQDSLVSKEGQDIVWRYKSKTCRDSDYSSLKEKISLSL